MGVISLRVFVAGVALLSVAAFLLVVLVTPGLSDGQVTAALFFTVLIVLARALPYTLARGAKGSITFFPAIGLAAICPSWIAVLSIVAAEFIWEIALRRGSLKLVFNVAQHSLTVALSILIFSAFGGISLLSADGYQIVPFALLFATYFATNSLLVSSVVATAERLDVLTVWRNNTKGSTAYDILSLPFVFLFAQSYVVVGFVGPALLAIPLLGVRELYRTNEQLQEINRELLELMVAAIEARDPYTSGHSRRVAQNAAIIGRSLGMSPRTVERLHTAALLHDVGKIHEEYAAILQKPGKLTEDERLIMETHPQRSADLISRVSQLKDVIEPIRHHHENWDGSGYPDGRRGLDIPIMSRIIMIADTIDAMMTDRPYRKALSGEQVTNELLRLSGKQFDPTICERLLNSSVHRKLLFQRASTQSVTPGSAPTSVGALVSRPLRVEAI